MSNHRTPLPPEIKELIKLIREGHLFEVQQWIQEGRPCRLPTEGRFITSPLEAAVQTGFHSMIELLLRHLADQENLNGLLGQAVKMRRLDLVELLCKFGADSKAITLDQACSTGNPLILRWFEDRGIDLETGNPLAEVFRWKKRGALGTYMRWKNALPGLKHQANMALRFHAKTGSMKWVSLLLWAGADPRVQVPDMENEPEEDFMGTALEEAFSHGHVEVVKKFKVNPRKDDIDHLLAETWLAGNMELVEMLLELGADPNKGGEGSAIQRYVSSLEWALESEGSFSRSPRELVDALCLMAAKGGRWRPENGYRYSRFRRALAQAPTYRSIDALSRLAKSGLFEQVVFKQLMSTPKMRSLLQSEGSGVIALRKLAELVRKPPGEQRKKS